MLGFVPQPNLQLRSMCYDILRLIKLTYLDAPVPSVANGSHGSHAIYNTKYFVPQYDNFYVILTLGANPLRDASSLLHDNGSLLWL